MERKAAEAIATRVLEVLAGDEPDIAYIKKNIRLLENYELVDVEVKIKLRDLRKRTGLYIKDNGEVPNTSIRLDLRRPIDELMERFEEQSGGYGDIDLKAYNQLSSIVTDYYLRHTKGDSYTISSMGYPLRALLNFLFYVLKGKVETDYKKVNDFLDENPDVKAAEYKGSYAFEFEGVKIRKFKNNRIDLKFKKKSDAEKCRDLTETWRKTAHESKQRW